MSAGEDYAWLYDLAPGEGDPAALAALAERLVGDDKRAAATVAYDRSFGLDPDDEHVAAARAALLDTFAVREHPLRFRYVPGGTYAIGSADGDPDERPVHLVRLSPFWLGETPISWSAYCALLGWAPPPHGVPLGPDDRWGGFMLDETNKIRLQYCEDATSRAGDWHAHAGGELADLFGTPPRVLQAPELDGVAHAVRHREGDRDSRPAPPTRCAPTAHSSTSDQPSRPGPGRRLTRLLPTRR